MSLIRFMKEVADMSGLIVDAGKCPKCDGTLTRFIDRYGDARYVCYQCASEFTKFGFSGPLCDADLV